MGQYFTLWKHISYPGRVRRTWISEPTGSLLEKCKEAGMKVEKRRSYYGDSPCIGDPITGVFFHHIRAHNNNNLHLPMSSMFIFIIHNVDHIYPAKGNSWRRGWDQGWPCSPCGGLYQILWAVETLLLVRLLFPANIFWYSSTFLNLTSGMQWHPSGPWQSPFSPCQHLDNWNP